MPERKKKTERMEINRGKKRLQYPAHLEPLKTQRILGKV